MLITLPMLWQTCVFLEAARNSTVRLRFRKSTHGGRSGIMLRWTEPFVKLGDAGRPFTFSLFSGRLRPGLAVMHGKGIAQDCVNSVVRA